jgi:hypothetical protein
LALQVAKDGELQKNVGPFPAHFFAVPAFLQRYAQKTWCQAITMTIGSAKPHARQREITELFGLRSQG